MTQAKRDEITAIAKEFAKPLLQSFGEIAGTGWLIVDPLSGYLNFCGIKNTLSEIAATETHPQILIMNFPDGSIFVPAGSDLPFPGSTDWLWITDESITKYLPEHARN